MIGKAVRSGRGRRWLPGLDLLRHYQRGWLRADVLAGVTVAAYSIPQVVAYAEVAGLPPVTGLWALICTLPVYAVLGSSRQLSVGPESTTALMTAAAIGPLALADTQRYGPWPRAYARSGDRRPASDPVYAEARGRRTIIQSPHNRR